VRVATCILLSESAPADMSSDKRNSTVNVLAAWPGPVHRISPSPHTHIVITGSTNDKSRSPSCKLIFLNPR
jgi:hypothetical protein